MPLKLNEKNPLGISGIHQPILHDAVAELVAAFARSASMPAESKP